MDFARPHSFHESVATRSNIRHVPVENKENPNLDDRLVIAANQAAVDLLLGSGGDPKAVDSTLYPERLTPQTETIQANQLVVVFESFDTLDFCYAERGAIFSNRNGHFHHDDFIGKTYGCKIRSRNNRGYGFVYLLKPTPELWARSLNHRTQIIHELDASMIVFYLNLRPNMTVVESGTGSGALSHCLLRTIAPQGHLFTYEFNELRSETARKEFAKNRVGRLVTVAHKDVCGIQGQGGFSRPKASVDAVILDLPEPWLAIPHAAFCLRPNGRIASYSPCVEQSQKTVIALKQRGFHSMKTMEFRLKEHYVDEVEYEQAPREKRPKLPSANTGPHLAAGETTSGGDDTGAEADNEKSEYETEGEQASLTVKNTSTTAGAANTSTNDPAMTSITTGPAATTTSTGTTTSKRKKILVARPFVMMRGHSAFITFATAGNKSQPDPNSPSRQTEDASPQAA